MHTRTLLLTSTALGLAASLAGCSVVLAPSRRQAGSPDASTTDGGTHDGGGLDTGPIPDTGPLPDTGADAGNDAGNDAGSDAGVDAGPPCTTGLECVAAAPGGWNGPILLVSGPGDASAPACPGAAPSTAFTGQSGLTASDAACGCNCVPPGAGSFSCGAATLRNTDRACTSAGSVIAMISNGACMTLSGLGTQAWTLTSPAMMGSGTCNPVPSTTLPPVTYAAAHRGCGFGTPTSCGASSVCAPTRGSGERLCVWVDGDAACPSSFPVSLSTSSGVNDTRSCTACTCGSVTGSCSGSVDIMSSCGGTPLLYATVPTNGCVTAVSAPTPVGFATYTPSPSCPPSAPNPTGSALPTGQRTVCCTS